MKRGLPGELWKSSTLNLLIINRTPTFYDAQVRVVINESTSEGSKLLLDQLKEQDWR
ncbi:MAG: hypothetical protein R6U91_10235 [Bacillota bacterium]